MYCIPAEATVKSFYKSLCLNVSVTTVELNTTFVGRAKSATGQRLQKQHQSLAKNLQCQFPMGYNPNAMKLHKYKCLI